MGIAIDVSRFGAWLKSPEPEEEPPKAKCRMLLVSGPAEFHIAVLRSEVAQGDFMPALCDLLVRYVQTRDIQSGKIVPCVWTSRLISNK